MSGSNDLLGYLERVVYGERHGAKDHLALAGLRVLSHAYRSGLGMYLLPFHVGLRSRKRLPVPVISIGNITVGGTGKTPTTLSVCEGLVSRGWKPAVLSYGYGGALKGKFSVVSTPEATVLSPRDAGDEPAMLAARLRGVPVLVGKHRYESGMYAVREFGSNVLVLDDGFQVWKLHRDLDIVLVDGVAPFDNGRTLPAGKLREPTSALRRAHCIVVTGLEPGQESLAAISSRISRIAPGVAAFSARHSPHALYAVEGGAEIGLESMRDQRVFAVSAIAHPASFERTLADAGAVIVGSERYLDHHLYTQEDVAGIEKKTRECGAEFIVVTEKDRVKLEGMRMEMPFLSLGTRLLNSDEEGFWRIIDGALGIPASV